MRKTCFSKLVVWICLGIFLSSLRAMMACPDCNIHNYLFSSLRSSSNVFAGEIVAGNKVRILNVYRGTNSVGTTVDYDLRYLRFSGNPLIFCDPRSHDLNFKQLPIELDWETKFILRKPWSEADRYPIDHASENNQSTIPEIRHKMEALKAVQGISRVTRQLGMEYVKKHKADCAPVIEWEVHRRQALLGTNGNPQMFDYCYAGLAEAYWLAKPTNALANCLTLIDGFLSRAPSVIDLENPNDKPSAEIRYIALSLGAAQGTAFSKPLIERLKTVIPQLDGMSLAAALYVCERSKLFDEEEVRMLAQTLAKEQPAKKDAIALAFYQLGCEFAPSWDYKKTLPCFIFARAHCEKSALLQKINDRIAWWEKRYGKQP